MSRIGNKKSKEIVNHSRVYGETGYCPCPSTLPLRAYAQDERHFFSQIFRPFTLSIALAESKGRIPYRKEDLCPSLRTPQCLFRRVPVCFRAASRARVLCVGGNWGLEHKRMKKEKLRMKKEKTQSVVDLISLFQFFTLHF